MGRGTWAQRTVPSAFPFLPGLPCLTCLALPAPCSPPSSLLRLLRAPPTQHTCSSVHHHSSTQHQASHHPRSPTASSLLVIPHTQQRFDFHNPSPAPDHFHHTTSGSSFRPSRRRLPDLSLVDTFPRLAQDGRQELGCSCLARAIQWQGSPFLGSPCL